MLRHLLRGGIDAYLVDWGEPDRTNADEPLAHHVEELLLPLLATLQRPPILVGYCLGGTIAIGAAARLAAQGMGARALCTIAAPVAFFGL